MKKWTILRAYFMVYLACCIIYTIAKWKILSYEEGWGVVAMVGLISMGLVGILADFIMTLIINNKRILNGIGLLIAIGFSIMLWIELK
ncbi:MAG: hypothetical protein WAO74_11880 [Polaribacter sp.]|uniref:hypothetical protein n=1 Tax=Polaribacter sp. TaxID=1920175 RepID=UPI003BAEA9C2